MLTSTLSMGGKEKPTNFELIINLKTVKQNSLTISPNVLARADKSHRMIEDERPDLVSTAGFIYKVRFKPESSSGLKPDLRQGDTVRRLLGLKMDLEFSPNMQELDFYGGRSRTRTYDLSHVRRAL
jgi:hypothetical protein